MSIKKLSVKKVKAIKGGGAPGIQCTYSSAAQIKIYGACHNVSPTM